MEPKTYQINENLSIRTIQESDAADLFQLVEHDRQELTKWMPWAAQIKTAKDELRFIKYALKQMNNGRLLPMCILYNNQVIGNLDLHEIDPENKNAKIGYWLGSQFQGQGSMTKSVKELISIGFNELHLHKIILEADASNQKSINIALKLNIKQEANFKEQLLVDEEYHNLLSFCLFEQ
ncbi:GNAT family protein [Pediococcus argentinicus]|uniref:GNAT family N-acetyltransferase n=1 Tax=Pediococcus argentinicus TaxID=480391 RepID=UPI0033900B00